MSRVETSIEIDAPPERVWDVVMDPDRLDEWVTIHRRVEKASEKPLEEGSTLEQTLCIRHTNFRVKWKVAEADAPRLAVWEGKGPARSRARTEYRLSANGDGGTRFDYVNDFKAPFGPLGSAAERVLVGGVSEREAKATLQSLKRLVEAG